MTQSNLTPEFIERFWSRVDCSGGPDACWLWLGGRTSPNKHGAARMHGHATTAHRVAWTIARGPVPAGMCVLHDCPGGDNPICVNPAHLWLGTVLENNRDRDAKGRGARLPGSLHPMHKLTESDVVAIRAVYAMGNTRLKDLAALYGVHLATIHLIVKRRTWQHI